MSWIAVARKDFRDTVQSRALWVLVAVFVALSVVSTYAYVEVPEMFGSPGGATFGGLIFFTLGISALFVPLAAIVVGYKSLAGERELGSIKLLLSLPTTRANVFAGKVLGRAAVLAVGLGVGLVAGLGFGAAMLGEASSYWCSGRSSCSASATPASTRLTSDRPTSSPRNAASGRSGDVRGGRSRESIVPGRVTFPGAERCIGRHRRRSGSSAPLSVHISPGIDKIFMIVLKTTITRALFGSDMANQPLKKSRRDVLKKTGLVATVAGTQMAIATASSDDDELHLATRPFVELKLEYRGATEHANAVGCGGLKYLTGDGLATLLNYSAWDGEPGDVVVGYDGNLQDPSFLQRGVTMKYLTAEGRFQGYGTRSFRLADSYEAEMPSVSARGDDVRVGFATESAVLGTSEQAELSLGTERVSVVPSADETREVEVRDRETGERTTKQRSVRPDPVEVTVEPVVTARAHGRTKFFGAEDRTVVPSDSDHVLAKHVRSEVGGAGDELVVATEAGENR